MSSWTHIVGCIRVDGIPTMGNRTSDISKALGPMSTFEQSNDSCTLPCGSEGSLQYRVIEYDSGLPWIAVPIWGDLRDYDDVEGITTWWKDTLQKFPMLRDAVLRVRVEGKEPITLDDGVRT